MTAKIDDKAEPTDVVFVGRDKETPALYLMSMLTTLRRTCSGISGKASKAAWVRRCASR